MSLETLLVITNLPDRASAETLAMANKGWSDQPGKKRPADGQEKPEKSSPQAPAPLAQVPDPGRAGVAAAGGRCAGQCG